MSASITRISRTYTIGVWTELLVTAWYRCALWGRNEKLQYRSIQMKQPTRLQLLPSYERSFLVMRLQVELKLSKIAVVIHEDPNQPVLQKLSFYKSWRSPYSTDRQQVITFRHSGSKLRDERLVRLARQQWISWQSSLLRIWPHYSANRCSVGEICVTSSDERLCVQWKLSCERS